MRLDLPHGLEEELNREFEYPYSGQWAQYAEWLKERGHPLGELIAAEQERSLTDPEWKPWDPAPPVFCDGLGKQGGEQEPSNYWDRAFDAMRYGYYRSLRSQSGDLGARLTGEDCRFLRQAAVDTDQNFFETLERIPDALCWLEELSLDDKAKINHAITTNNLPRLRVLTLSGSSPTALASDTLRTLVTTSHVTAHLTLVLPQLCELCLCSFSEEGRNARWLESVFSATGIPNLKRLDLTYLATDEICEALADCELAGQLEELNLARGRMGDRGAAALAKSTKLKLKVLRAPENVLTSAGQKLLERIADKVQTPYQNMSTDGMWECGEPVR